MRACLLVVALAIVILLSPSELYAYIGPGAGLSAFGALISLAGAIVVGILGFVWYPIKRLIRALKRRREPSESLQPDSMTR